MAAESIQSFIPVDPASHFPLHNLPYGVFRPAPGESPRVGVAIGEWVLDLAKLERAGLLNVASYGGRPVFDRASLNPFMALGRPAWCEVRRQLQQVLAENNPILRDQQKLRREVLQPQIEVEMLLPFEIGDYTDFYSSREHATNVGSMLRGPDKALMPNWLHLPVAYHGRASSIVVSGTDLRRPWGQVMPEGATRPQFVPSAAVDFELEVGFVIGPGNRLGQPVPADQALEHVFGLVLVNDWSARDIQKWEYMPLGPFLAKNFGTSISPWVVTLEALAPFQTQGPEQDPTPLPYLQAAKNPTWDIRLEVWLQTASMPQGERICASNLKNLYWNVRQQIAHHTCGGCNLRTGDLLATGTISGPVPEARGCLLELTWGGKQPLRLSNGEERRFLEDGDQVTMTGWSQGDGCRVGFGAATGKILPAVDPPR